MIVLLSDLMDRVDVGMFNADEARASRRTFRVPADLAQRRPGEISGRRNAQAPCPQPCTQHPFPRRQVSLRFGSAIRFARYVGSDWASGGNLRTQLLAGQSMTRSAVPDHGVNGERQARAATLDSISRIGAKIIRKTAKYVND